MARSWTGQLPVAGGPGGQPPRKPKLAQDLIELWNRSYFASRGVELVLFKGQQRRTKSQAAQTQRFFDTSDDDFESSSTDSSEWEGQYGRHHEERRKRRKERKAKRSAYTVYVACTNAPAHLGAVPQSVGYPMPMPTPYAVPSPVGYPAFIPNPPGPYPMPYGAPVGIPKTRSHGHSGGY